MATVASTPRTNSFTVATAMAGPFSIGFRLFETNTLEVYVDGVITDDWAITAAFVNGYDDAATLTFGTVMPVGTAVQIDGALVPTRAADYLNGDPGLARKLNIELPRIWSSLSEINMKLGRTIRSNEAIPVLPNLDPDDFTVQLSNTTFGTRALAEAANVAAPVYHITVISNGVALNYIDNSASTALTTNGGTRKWGPAGQSYLQHWGLMTHSSEAAANAAALAMTSGEKVTHQARLVAAFGEQSGELVIKGFVEAFDQLTANPGRIISLFSGADFNAICFHADRMNMSAACCVQAGTTAGGGCVVESLHLLFDQSQAATSGLDAHIKAYPRAFDCAGDWGTLNYLRISRGNNGFAAARTDAANNGGWKIGRIESGCFGRDIEFNGAQHFIDAADIDLWPQGFAGNANLLAIYKARAATTKKVYIGRNDGLTIGRIGLFAGGIVEIDGDVVSGSGLPIMISGLQLDADGAALLLTSGRSEIGLGYATEAATSPQLDYKIKCVGGTHTVAQSDIVGDATPLIQVEGGTLTLTGRLHNTNLTVGQIATVSGGVLNLQDCQFVWPTGARSVPAIEQSGTGVLRIIGGTVEAATAGVLAKFNTDVAGNFVQHGVFFPHTVTIPSGSHVGNYGRNQRADWVERAAAGWRAMPGEIIWADGVAYVGSSGATAISDLPGMLPAMWVSPDHFGGKTKTAIDAAIAYHQTICGTAVSATTAASTALPFIFGAGLHNSGGAAITYATAGVETVIKGQNRATRLNNVTFQIGDHRCEISDLAMEGNAKATDAFSFTPRGGNLRGGLVQNIHIQGARYGLYSTGDVAWLRFNHIYAEKNTRGFQFDRVIGFTTEFCQFTTSDEQGGLILRGGEYRDIGSRFNGNKKAGLRFDGSAATGISQVVVENYLNGTSISGNYTDVANRPTWSITGAASNGAGGTRLTLNVSGGRHLLSDSVDGVVIAGTTDYNGTWAVSNVTNTTVDISATYTSSQTGTIKHPGFDLEAIGDVSIRASQLNDLWIANCNFNFSYFKDCFGVRIDGGRPKQQIFLDGNCYGFSRVSNGRGRMGSDVDDGGTAGTWSPVPFTGQNYGFVESISSVEDSFTGEVSMITRGPDPTVALIGNNIQAYCGNKTNGSGTEFDGPVVFNGPVSVGGVDLEEALDNIDAQSIMLSAIAAASADTITNMFVYDTRLDADGGAWRFNRSASWYNETLGTSVRGSRREFPAVAVIYSTANSFTILDGDDPALPRWKKYQTPTTSGGLGVLRQLSSYPITGITALNGRIHFSSATAGYHFLDFAGDYAGKMSNTGSTSGYVFPLASYYNKDITTGLTPGFVNNNMNAIAAVVLPGAPINPMTGQPTATIIVGTNGGLSIRKDNNTMANSTATGAVYKVRVDGTRVIYQQVGVGQYCTIDLVGIATGFSPTAFTESSVPAMKQAVASTSKLAERAAAGSSGVTLIQPNFTTAAASMVNNITADHQTGWMVGDIQGCWLSSIDSTSMVGGTVTDRSVKALNLNVTGTITRSAVQTGAELMGYGGWSAGVNELTLTDAAIVNTLYGMCWVEVASGTWALQRGIMSGNPIEGVTISGTTITVAGSFRKALLRLSATTPSANQIAKIEADEYRLFEAAAACTLYSTDSDVKALYRDKQTGLMHVGTGAGRSTFQGLIRVSNTTTAVTTAIAAASGMIAEQ